MASGEGYWKLQFSSNWKTTWTWSRGYFANALSFNEDNIQLNAYVRAGSLIQKKSCGHWDFLNLMFSKYAACTDSGSWRTSGWRKFHSLCFELILLYFYNSVKGNMKGKRKWKGWRLQRVVEASCKTSREVDEAKAVAKHEPPPPIFSIWERQFSNHIA